MSAMVTSYRAPLPAFTPEAVAGVQVARENVTALRDARAIAAAKLRAEAAEAAFRALTALELATLLREAREAMEAAEDFQDVAGWEYAAAGCVALLRECDRRNPHPEPVKVAMLDRFEADLEAGVLGPVFGVIEVTKADRKAGLGRPRLVRIGGRSKEERAEADRRRRSAEARKSRG